MENNLPDISSNRMGRAAERDGFAYGSRRGSCGIRDDGGASSLGVDVSRVISFTGLYCS